MSLHDILYNVNVISESILTPPQALKKAIPASDQAYQTVLDARQTVAAIIERRDPRQLVVVGPCSIHDIAAAKEYAHKLKKLHDELKDTLYIMMRVYFEKPRTAIGWKGFINDPDLDESCDMEKGIHQARALLLWLAELGLPVGTEALDPLTPQYLADLYSWAAIGARTIESQTHRELASGLSMPVGFKNSTAGGLDVAINAIRSSASGHKFLGVNDNGQITIFHTQGNHLGHLILRGGKQPNYDSVHVRLAEQALTAANLPARLIVDCSHGNSYKQHELQTLVAENVIDQVANGNQVIMGIMLESNLKSGNQPFPDPTQLDKLTYGQSITDACIGWNATEKLLQHLHRKLT
ncbi:MAG TPA: 3-deoxy-7-phosphoheptulonate synthase [Anaerolineae bacterium]|nr:3-deoxy-7-phosphoheptulonate synthase [Anaerolineae bacterium]